MCNTIAHSIQSRLLYAPAKFQGTKTNRTRATSNFLRPFKTGNYFCGIVVWDVAMRHQRMIYIQYNRESIGSTLRWLKTTKLFDKIIITTNH